MVWRKPLTVLLEGEQNVTLTVQRPAHRDRRPIVPVRTLRKLPQRARKVDVLMLLTHPGDAQVCEDVAQSHTGPDAVGHCASAPVEADGLLGHILLLPPVARADEGDREAHHRADLPGDQIVHAQLASPTGHAGDFEAMVTPGDLRHCAVIADDVQGGGRHPAGLLQLAQRRLRVEGVAPGETDHVRVALDPLIRRVPVTIVHLPGLLLLWHGQARRPHMRGQPDVALNERTVVRWLRVASPLAVGVNLRSRGW
mmetsp:Transcript_65971/g.148862  ORF Transcript_65971/g.148862 Transcript_65971/m.148862 type:complete len:254 (-) Transcript_65971:590-1351(-)